MIMNSANDVRSLTRVTPARHTIEGEGFEVRRAVPAPGLEAVGPFIFLDHWGPTTYGPGEAKGAPDHPHAGFETLTYLLEGSSVHRDSLGNVSRIGPLAAQWMRAGRGIIHDEGPDAAQKRQGGPAHGVQLWIDLPPGRKEEAPAYKHVGADMIPEFAEGGATVRLVAGRIGDLVGPVETFAAPFLAHVRLQPGAAVTLPLPDGIEAAAYVLAGAVRVGEGRVAEGRVVADGNLAVLAEGNGAVRLAAEAGDAVSDLLVLGGPRIAAALVRYGPFVGNSRDDLVRAVERYQRGQFGQLAPAAA